MWRSRCRGTRARACTSTSRPSCKLSAKPMRRLLLSIAGLLILLAVAVPAGAIYYAAFTESGLKFIVGLVPHEFAGVRLDLVNPSGTIARGIHVERVAIDPQLRHL